MNWNQIEDKWAAMTRRIRADWKDVPRDTRGPRAMPHEPQTGTQSSNGQMPGNLTNPEAIMPPKA